MSQEKVDKYKEDKKNRKKIIAREKRIRIAWMIIGLVVLVAVILAIVLSIMAQFL